MHVRGILFRARGLVLGLVVSLVGVNPICIPNWGHGCLLNQYMDVFNEVFSSLFYDVLKHVPLPCTIWLVYATLYKLKWHPSSTVWFQNSSVIVNVCSRIYLECRSYRNRLWKRMDAYFSYMPTIWMSFKTHKLELCFIDNARHALTRSNIWYINCWALAYPVRQGSANRNTSNSTCSRPRAGFHEIVRAQNKVSKGIPKTPPKSCSVVTDPCEVICDRALNQMLFQWISSHAGLPHTW
jgi:hypothetical protein